MGYRVVTFASYDDRFDRAVAHRLRYYGVASARRLLDAQDSVAAMLSAMPYMGTLVDAPILADADDAADDALRWVKMDVYIVVYRPVRTDETVLLVDVFYGSEDWRAKIVHPRPGETASK